MQVILTEEEYLKLKNQSSKDKETYVKRIDVAIALQEMVKELSETYRQFDPMFSNKTLTNWQGVMDRFMEKVG